MAIRFRRVVLRLNAAVLFGRSQIIYWLDRGPIYTVSVKLF